MIDIKMHSDKYFFSFIFDNNYYKKEEYNIN